ncbi:hypothetical protein TRSC58_07622 [Trypanosoma rangeli SC58]|uniref:Uncharacterized protein n=1 Tax=Trypanosoma rangeli SC58 TaxID=429131 RepID=A0A061ISI0_TRYRA|nr:hypothetical protein TRSC58_07622 [Trypanosoma rangeli SC58]
MVGECYTSFFFFDFPRLGEKGEKGNGKKRKRKGMSERTQVPRTYLQAKMSASEEKKGETYIYIYVQFNGKEKDNSVRTTEFKQVRRRCRKNETIAIKNKLTKTKQKLTCSS